MKPKMPDRRPVRRDRNGLVRCRVCGCTETEPCDPPCAWEQGEEDLCTGCAGLVQALLYWRIEGAPHPSLAALLREVQAQAAYVPPSYRKALRKHRNEAAVYADKT